MKRILRNAKKENTGNTKNAKDVRRHGKKRACILVCLAVCLVLCAFSFAGCGTKSDEKTLKIGVTVYKPMNYKDENGKWTGFETEFAEAVCERMGMQAEFVVIDWNSKVMELNAGNIDCIWNGMTVTEQLKEAIALSESYIANEQVCVIRKADADRFGTLAAMSGAAVVAEQGSAGATVAENDANLKKQFTAVEKQTDALMEVKSMTADVAVVDIVMAKASVGEGTDYDDLMIVSGISLPAEEYAVGFRREDTDLLSRVNQTIRELTQDGTLAQIAEKYGLADRLVSAD